MFKNNQFTKGSLFKHLPLLFLAISLTFSTTTFTSCSPKSGCKINEAGAKTNRRGELSQKRGKTNLLPKKYRKKSR